MKQNIILAIAIIILFACGAKSTKNKTVNGISEMPAESINNTGTNNVEQQIDSENATYFVTIADTSFDYTLLLSKMLILSKTLNIPIDTMGRFYNKKKKLIALPDNDKDEIYAGKYYPRRYPSEYLSLEYLDFYKQPASEKMIALVTGIYETQTKADSSLTQLKQKEKKAFVVKADIYIGCMH